MEEYDEGFARNLMRLTGDFGGDWQDFANRKLKAVSLRDDKTVLVFEFEDGGKAEFTAEGDCCSHSWFEHLEAPDTVEGLEVLAVEDQRMEHGWDGEEDMGDYLQSYQTILRLNNGESIKVEYRNSSNGYYGGYLERVR